MAKETVLKAFEGIWSDLFSSQTHLDSALSKQSKSVKSILAQILPRILLRPVSMAEAVGVGVAAREPWSLNSAEKSRWRPAKLIAEKIYEGMTDRPVAVEPTRGDFPTEMVTEWEETWGSELANELVMTLGTEPPLGLRARHTVGAEKLLQELTAGSRLPVKAQLSSIAPMGVRLDGYAPVLGTETYASGAFEIQDEGSQLMSLFALWPELYAPLLSARPGQVSPEEGRVLPTPPEAPPAWNVVDACAGAGGKSLAMADALKGRGRVYSYDISERKLQALRRRATHAGYNNIQAVAVEEGKEEATVSRFRRRAQVVLVDAPCSGWGVLRRNPDIKWRQEPDVLERMPKIQERLLSVYSDLVAPEGRLVFGVCTFRKAETRDIVESFLKAHPDFESVHGGYLGPGPCDGFFMHAFKRKK